MGTDLVLIPWISIHAPVKGATWQGFRAAMDDTISIHAPVKGATNASRLVHG